MNPPLFNVGQRILVERYAGVLSSDDSEKRKKDWRPFWCRIEGIRLKATIEEDWNDETEDAVRVVKFDRGWEYLLVSCVSHTEWGWEREAKLVEAGYPLMRLASAS